MYSLITFKSIYVKSQILIQFSLVQNNPKYKLNLKNRSLTPPPSPPKKKAQALFLLLNKCFLKLLFQIRNTIFIQKNAIFI